MPMTPAQAKLLSELHDAIVGNHTGNPGLVRRMTTIESSHHEHVKRTDRKFNFLAGGGAAIFSLIELLTHFFGK